MTFRRVGYCLGAAVAACFTVVGWVGLSVRPSTVQAAPSPLASAAAADGPAAAVDTTFHDKITPFLTKYCTNCHNGRKAAGGLALDAYQNEAHARRDRKTWESVLKVMAAGEMPPKKKPQPSKDERTFVSDWIANTLTKVDCQAPKDPGRVTLRRLNRAEYNNTIRDLCGVDFHPADDFPADDVGYGFDNIGDVLSLQPVLLEKYLSAAEKVLEQALAGAKLYPLTRQPYGVQPIQAEPGSAKTKPRTGSRKILFTTKGTASLEKFNFPNDAEYVFRLRAWGTNVGGAYPKVVLRVAGKDLHTFTVAAAEETPSTYEFRARVAAGEAVRVGYTFTNAFTDAATHKSRSLGVRSIEIEGPFNPTIRADAPVRKVLPAIPAGNADKAEKAAAARKTLAAFAHKAFRRPVRPDEIARLVKLYELADKQGDPFEEAIKLPLKAVLASPHFLYRVEADPADPAAVRTLGDHELAVRLSYFLWSTMPDAALLALADRGELQKPGVLEAQVKRMLRDPKSHALGENFAGQWLQLRTLQTLAPDKGYFPAWRDSLRRDMSREAELFFENVVREDRGVLEFLDANYSFLNERLAAHYGIKGVSGSEFRKVSLPDGRRGGVITMASTLTVTSNPTRTSPVKRGKWILENILGTPPPPPAPDAGELPPTEQIKGTIRQQMEQHRANPSCAVCHARLDPLGLALENFNAIGSWRTTDNKLPIDTVGVLPDGEKIDGPATLKKALLGKADLFRRCLAEKMLTYALGRGLEYYDKCVLDDVTAKLTKGQDRFSALVLAVVQSDPFQKRKGKRSE